MEFAVRQGRQMFVISWRNPDSRHAAWDLDTYVRAVLDALDAVERDHRQRAHGARRRVLRRHHREPGRRLPRRHRPAGPAGRVLPGRDGASTTTRPGRSSALVDEPAGGRGQGEVARARGYLDGRALAEVFAWLRPGDLVWNYWVNNYLLGKRPPAFDILFWNSDTTRMTAGLHADFVDLAMQQLA